jgi:hypothetical protein
MTEAEWLSCTDPTRMLQFLRGKVGDRKLRLFAVACFAHLHRLLPSSLGADEVQVAERFADGLAPAEELQGASARLMDAINVLLGQWRGSRDAGEAEQPHVGPTYEALALASHVTSSEAQQAAHYASLTAREVYARIVNPGLATRDEEYLNSRQEEERKQADLLRDLLGSLSFLPPPPLPPAVLAWNDGIVRRLAESIYEERQMPEGTLDTDRLAVLADALLDSGCDDEKLIQHCRSEGPHYRGCWPIDIILGKE